MVDAAIDRPRDALHDERHDLPAVGRHGLDVRRRRRACRVVRDELVARVAIEELDLRRRIALRIRRVAQRRRRRVRVAVVRRHLRAGEHRPADRMVRDRDLAPAAVGAACGEDVLAVLQARDEAGEAAVRRAANELEMSRPFRTTRTLAGSVPVASATATSASPPKRGRLDSTGRRSRSRSRRRSGRSARRQPESGRAREPRGATRVAVVIRRAVAAVPIVALLGSGRSGRAERNRFPDILNQH